MWVESDYQALMADLDTVMCRQARALAGRDAFLRDDLMQEMAIALLQAGPGHKRAYYKVRALGAAHDYMRKTHRWGKREHAAGGLNDLAELDERSSLDECAVEPVEARRGRPVYRVEDAGRVLPEGFSGCPKCGGTGCGERVL